MSLCMNCATIMHPKDAKTHTCDPANVPAKGSPKKLLR